MKIGIDISQIAYQGSGIASYTQNLVKALLKIDNKNQYILFASALRRSSEIKSFIKTLDTDNYQFKIYPFPPKLMTLLWNKLHVLPIENFIGHIDVFHTSDWLEPPSLYTKVTTIHDMLIFKHPEYIDPQIIDNQKNKLRWVTKETAVIIADSYSTKNDIIKYLKIPEHKIKVIYLGIDKSYYPQSFDVVQKVKHKYNLNFDYLLCLGISDPRKNWSLIMQAYSDCHLNNIKLVGVNSFMQNQQIHKSDNIVLNYVDREDMPALYSGAKAFIYPSIYEGFGLPVLEAMACGVPVITSVTGSLKEIIGENGLLVNPSSVDDLASKINQVLKLSNEERINLINKGIQHAKQFKWEKTAQETLKIYESLI